MPQTYDIRLVWGKWPPRGARSPFNPYPGASGTKLLGIFVRLPAVKRGEADSGYCVYLRTDDMRYHQSLAVPIGHRLEKWSSAKTPISRSTLPLTSPFEEEWLASLFTLTYNMPRGMMAENGYFPPCARTRHLVLRSGSLEPHFLSSGRFAEYLAHRCKHAIALRDEYVPPKG